LILSIVEMKSARNFKTPGEEVGKSPKIEKIDPQILGWLNRAAPRAARVDGRGALGFVATVGSPQTKFSGPAAGSACAPPEGVREAPIT